MAIWSVRSHHTEVTDEYSDVTLLTGDHKTSERPHLRNSVDLNSCYSVIGSLHSRWLRMVFLASFSVAAKSIVYVLSCVINSFLWSILHITSWCCCLQAAVTALTVMQSGITAEKDTLVSFWFPLLFWCCEHESPCAFLQRHFSFTFFPVPCQYILSSCTWLVV